MKLSINTHDYDYKLRDIAQKIKEDNKNITMTYKEALELTLVMNEQINNNNGIVIKTINMFNDKKNYDPTNCISVEELLPIIVDKINKCTDNKDLKKIYLEQLSDIYTRGSCAQGRCTRLLQLLI